MFRRKQNLVKLILLLSVALICFCAIALNLYLQENRMPEGEVKQMVWKYAKKNGFSYRSYPEQLIDLLERNPETKTFVLEYPFARDAKPAIDITAEIQEDTVPLFLQWDQRWGYLQYGDDYAALTACGPVCLSMCGAYLTKSSDFSPEKLIQFANENGYYVPGAGSSWTLISQGGIQLGLQVKEIPLVENLILQHLSAGTPIICAMGPGDFTSTGHFIVLTGVSDGLLQINDPNSRSNSEKLWKYEDICGQIRNLWTIAA